MKPWYLYISNVHVYIKISQHLGGGGGGDWSQGGENPGHPPHKNKHCVIAFVTYGVIRFYVTCTLTHIIRINKYHINLSLYQEIFMPISPPVCAGEMLFYCVNFLSCMMIAQKMWQLDEKLFQ